MRKIFTYVSLCLFSIAYGQAPSGYYSGTENLSKDKLKSKLSSIISSGHKDKGYDALYTAYKTSDIDKYYENDGSLLDMYSENPKGNDPYTYNLGKKQCGNYSGEGDCYNREHSIPQSTFNKKSPMVNDAHHIVPTDGYVNGKRSSFPFGEVKSASWTSKNGSKLGSSNVSGYSGTVFEPIDEFKGDFARIMFYFVTRYESQISGFDYEMFSNSGYPGLSSWSIPMLLKWHRQDPVNQREIDRNNALYTFQGNRNPFIDNPNFVELIWGDGNVTPPATPDNEKPTAPSSVTTGEITATSAYLSWTASNDNTGVVSYKIYNNGTLFKTISANQNSSNKLSSNKVSRQQATFSTTITGLTPETNYSLQITGVDASNNESEKSAAIVFTTPKGETGTGTPGASCGFEGFDNIEFVKDGYSTITYTSSNNITWTATDARTDQNITDRAVTFRKLGSLKTSTINNGIGTLNFKYKNPFTSDNSVLKIKVIYNNTSKEYTTPVTQTLENISLEFNIYHPFTLEFSVLNGNNSTNNRITIDDISWNCYTLSTNEVIKNNNVKVYPNPIKNQEFFIDGLKTNETVNIYSMTGQLVQSFNNVQNKQNLNLKKLPKGIYIVKTASSSTKVIVE